MHTIENTLFIGKVIRHFTALDSTNEYAVEYLSKSKPPEGTVISAYNQTCGRGQIGSNWESEAGMNLTLSVILYPTFLKATSQFLLNQSIALGVYDFLQPIIGTELSLKWPNDIYFKNKKTGGILLQSSINGNSLKWCVAGIGLNINQTQFSSDAPNPTSLTDITGKTFDLESLKLKLFKHLEFRYLQLKQGRHAEIQEDYLNCCYRFMEEGLFERPNGEVFSGKIVGVDPIGKLKIMHQKGEEVFGMKEIRFV